MLALSASGVEVDKPNREGLTALQVAAGQGAPAVIAALAQRGAKVDQLSANDLSPLMLAVKMNNKDQCRGAACGWRQRQPQQ